VRQLPGNKQQTCWEHGPIRLAVKSEILPLAAGHRQAWKGFSNNAWSPGENPGETWNTRTAGWHGYASRKEHWGR